MFVADRWMHIARSFLGIHEGTSLQANPKVLRFFKEAGHAEVRNDHDTPWCAAFVGAVLFEAKLHNTHSLWALDYAKWGHKLDRPVYGAICTKTRHGGGHVFFCAGANDSYIFGLGGNQGDKVSIAAFPRRDITGFNWPIEVPRPSVAEKMPTEYADAVRGAIKET